MKHQGDFFGEYQNNDTALNVNEGVAQQPIVNPYIKNFYKKKPALKTVDEYMEGIIAGNTTILGDRKSVV